MDGAMGAKPVRVTFHCRSTVLPRVDLSGAAEVAPHAIRGASGDAILHDEPPIHTQSGNNQRLDQGPGNQGGEPPVIARVSQEKYGVRILNDIPQPRQIRPGRLRLKILFIG